MNPDTPNEPAAAGPAATCEKAAGRMAASIRALVRRFSISERADVACCGMTVAQAATLDILRLDGPMRLKALGARLGVAPSTLTRNLERLRKRGFVSRTADPGDSRAAGVALTAAGRRAAVRVARQENAFARAVMERLPPERRAATVEMLDGLLRAVRDETQECCPGAFDHLMQEFPVSIDIPRGARRDRRKPS